MRDFPLEWQIDRSVSAVKLNLTVEGISDALRNERMKTREHLRHRIPLSE